MEKLEEKRHSIEALITNLQVISNISKYEKLICKNVYELDVDKRYVQSIRRFIGGDSRHKVLQFLHQMFLAMDTEIEYLLKMHSNGGDVSTIAYTNNYMHELYINSVNAKRGLFNLIETYVDDVAVKSRLELFMNNLERKIENLRHNLQIKVT
jgi:hypothetical protein